MRRKLIKFTFLIVIFSSYLFTSEVSEEKILRRIYAHTLIEDYEKAYLEAKDAVLKFPDSMQVKKVYIESLFAQGKELEGIDYIHTNFDENEKDHLDRTFLENISWNILNIGSKSTQYSIRLASIIGSYLTRDVGAIKVFLKAMRDSNAIIRSVAVQLASEYGDAILKNEIRRLLKEERVWLVRLELIKAIGKLNMKDQASYLREIAASPATTYEEKALAIEALITIYDKLSVKELNALAESERSGLRQFMCEVAAYQKEKKVLQNILALAKDSNCDVRISAYNAISLFYKDICSSKQIKQIVYEGMEDNNPVVAITAARLGMLCSIEEASNYFSKWIQSESADIRRLSSGAIASLGSYGVALAKEWIKKSKDKYVRANLALGLIGQQENIKQSCKILSKMLKEKDSMWMWDNSKNPLINVLSPSHIRHVDQIPQYPEAIDMMAQLHVLSILIMMHDEKAEEMTKTFLKNKRWGISGFAAATLVQEGDEDSLEIVRSLLNDDDTKVRIQGALVLAHFGRDEAALPILKQTYEKADREMKLVILEALGHIGKAESFAFFLEVLKEPFPLLRIISASSLIQCVNH